MKADDARVPTAYGHAARRALVEAYGLPNAAPREGESVFATRRELFVDDDDGRPVSYWEPRDAR